jgi:VCBS repeat-containing protein
VLFNDLDPDNAVLTATTQTAPQFGTFELDPSGTFTYTHNGSEDHFDSFTYITSDGEFTDTAVVTITVINENDPPEAHNDSAIVDEGGVATTLLGEVNSVLANDFDPDHDTLTATIDIDADYGSLTLNPDGTFSYEHNGSETSEDSFRYVVSDGQLGSPALVTISINPVNDPPVASGDSINVDEGATITKLVGDVASVLENDVDPDSTLSANVQTDVTHGILDFYPNGTFSYTHNGSETTSDSFTYSASDGEFTASAVVNININPVNDPPIAIDDGYTTRKGIKLEIDPPGVLMNDSDAENDTLYVTLKTEASNGDLRLYVDGSLDYTPDKLFVGVDDFDYLVCDPHDDCVDATVTISVTTENAAPFAMDDHYYTDPEELLNVPVDLGLLANDSDAETDKFSLIVSQETSVSRGKLELNNNGSFTFTPPEDYIGIVSFTYRASDGELYSNIAAVTITVGDDVEPPTISWLSPSIDEDAWIDVGTQIYPLEVKVSDNVEVAVVNFRRWEPNAGTNGDWVYLGSVDSSPFRLELDTSTINLGFNQITAEAYDSSSNFSESNIFLRRWGGLIHMPVVSYKND